MGFPLFSNKAKKKNKKKQIFLSILLPSVHCAVVDNCINSDNLFVRYFYIVSMVFGEVWEKMVLNDSIDEQHSAYI